MLAKGVLVVLLIAFAHAGSFSQSVETAATGKVIESKTILFVTGTFVSNRGCDEWKKYFESKGYKTYVPAWPHKDGVPKNLRKNIRIKNLLL